MSFSGSLSEFDISNIFLLIEQDSATGELIVVTGDNRYVISFKNGQVVNARSEAESIRRFLFVYLKQVKNYSGMEIKELDTTFHNNNRLLSDELLKKGYLDQKEMAIIVQSGIIDITSIVFSIKKGNYIFDTKPNMDADQFLTLAIPANFVLLESARKTDEEGNIGSIITADSIFESAMSIHPEQVHDPVTNFSLYVIAHVNGARTTAELCSFMFFSSCHVYTALNEAYRSGKITLVNTPDSTLKPLRQRVERQNSDTSSIMIASATTGIISITIFIMGLFLFRGNLWRTMIENQRTVRHQSEVTAAEQKLRNAQLLYQGLNNQFPLSYRQLREAKLLSDKEIILLRHTGSEPQKK